MATDLSLRPATLEDTEAILELLKLSLGEGGIPRHAGYWNWKHHQNPFGPSPCVLAVAGEDIVGLRVFMRWCWKADGQTFSTVRAVDTATHPDWRGRGIFTRLTLRAIEDLEAEGTAFVFNTPNRQSLPGYLKMGWEEVGRISLWIRPLSFSPSAWRSSVATDEARSPEPRVGRPVSELLEDAGLRAFLERLRAPRERLATPRCAEYFRWRYGLIPDIRYRAVWQFDGDRGAALVFRLKDGGRGRELRLCEVLIPSTRGSGHIARGLLASVIDQLDAQYAVAMATDGRATARWLLRSGFLPAPRMGPVMTVRKLNGGASTIDPMRRGSWRLSIGDLELF